MKDISTIIKENRSNENVTMLESSIASLKAEGFDVEFGKIGERTNYALIYNEGHKLEYVGYTFLRNMKYYQETVGKLKALQQAMARKKIAETENK